MIKGIQVVYTHSSRKKPEDAIAEMYGKSGDINDGFGGIYVWLVPVWTTKMVVYFYYLIWGLINVLKSIGGSSNENSISDSDRIEQ